MSDAKKLLVRAAAESQVGNAHGYNEDNVYFNGDFITPRTIRQEFAIKTGEYSDINVFAVLDGMGRNNTGSFASLLAAKRLDEVADRVAFDTANEVDQIVLDYIRGANDEIREQIRETGGVRTASTLALAVVENDTVHAYNAGDSRIYLYRDRQLVRLSRDHIAVRGQRSVALSEENVRNGGLTKYLGMPESEGTLEPYRAKPFKIKKGDKLLLCSDGLTDAVDEEEIAECLSKRKDPFGHTNELISLALNGDSADNISVVVAEVVEPGFHITQNMILAALGCLIMLVGMLIGGVLGYIIGAGSNNRAAGYVDYTNQTQTPPTTPTFATTGGDAQPVSGADAATPEVLVSGSDLDDESGGSTATTIRTLYPTTTYPTTTTAPYPVEGIELSSRDFTMRVGKQQQIGIIIYPEELNVPMSAVHWTSSNEAVATVDENGVVTAIAPGNATIKATILGMTAEDNIIEECVVRVKRNKK